MFVPVKPEPGFTMSHVMVFLHSSSSVKMRVIIRLLILVELMFKLSFCNDLQNTSQETVD
jgi:hypothetical protein